MSAATRVESSFGPSPEEAQRLSRTIRWSIGVHVVLVAVLVFIPRSWWTSEPEKKNVMMISLGGTLGQRTTGVTSIGGRAVEQAVPPPKRPEPVRPTPEKPPAPAVVTKPVQKPAATPKPVERPVPAPPATTRPPVTGPQVTAGNTTVETGARGQGAGLSFNQGGTGGETDLRDFCCPEYLAQMLGAIDARWTKKPSEDSGTTVLKFTINRDGSIDNVLVETTSGSGILDRTSRGALQNLRLPALPADYTNPTLTVHLKFPYGQ